MQHSVSPYRSLNVTDLHILYVAAATKRFKPSNRQKGPTNKGNKDKKDPSVNTKWTFTSFTHVCSFLVQKAEIKTGEGKVTCIQVKQIHIWAVFSVVNGKVCGTFQDLEPEASHRFPPLIVMISVHWVSNTNSYITSLPVKSLVENH